MKKFYKKLKSFTLLEILVSVGIFVVVVGVTVVSLGIVVSSKSKIMAQIQEMVESGNTTPGVFIFKEEANGSESFSEPCSLTSNVGLGSFTTNNEGWRVNQLLKFKGDQIQIKKHVFDPAVNSIADINYQNILPQNMKILPGAQFSGQYRSSSCLNIATAITVNFTLQMQTTGTSGDLPQLQLTSTFTPNYPAPDKAGDSV